MRTHTQNRQNLSQALRLFLFKVLALLLLLSPDMAFAGLFAVRPIKVVFDKKTRSAVIIVHNEDKEEPLQVQMKAFTWTQDAAGKDQYKETNDLIFFPKIATINPNMERIIRVGVKRPSAMKENTYRLFIKEIPRKISNQAPNTINVSIRFGVPIFVEPANKALSGKIEQITLGDGALRMAIHNAGNTHFVIQSIRIRGTDQGGKEHFSKELSGWYLLNGSKRAYATDIPPDICQRAATFDVEVKTRDFSLHEKLNVDQSLCLH